MGGRMSCSLMTDQSYFTTMSGLYRKEFTELVAVFSGMIRKPTDEELEACASQLNRLHVRFSY
jgi:hypothetical protein